MEANRTTFEKALDPKYFKTETFSDTDSVLKKIQDGKGKVHPDILLCDIFFYPQGFEEASKKIEGDIRDKVEDIRKLGDKLELEIKKIHHDYDHNHVVGGISLAEAIRKEYLNNPPFPIFAYTSKGSYLLQTEDFNRIEAAQMRWFFKKVFLDEPNPIDMKLYSERLTKSIMNEISLREQATKKDLTGISESQTKIEHTLTNLTKGLVVLT